MKATAPTDKAASTHNRAGSLPTGLESLKRKVTFASQGDEDNKNNSTPRKQLATASANPLTD